MISNQKNYYSTRILGLAFLVLLLMLCSFFFVGTQIIPEKLNSEVAQSCIHHLKDKSYQIKQVLLENVNNSKLWIQNRQNTFFDSKWFAISYYEHDGKEWVLKDFKLNNVVLDIYKIAQSEYIKVDQSLPAPSASSEQITLQESTIADTSVLVLDIPNNVTNIPANHLIRITLFTDLFSSTLNSDEKCRLSLMDTKGNFLLQNQNLSETSFLRALQNDSHASTSAEVSMIQYADQDVFNYKILKSLYVLAFTQAKENVFMASFVQIGIFNLLAIAGIILIALGVLYQHFQTRLQSVNANLKNVSQKNYHLQFDLSTQDELSSTEEEISRLADELRKSKKS